MMPNIMAITCALPLRRLTKPLLPVKALGATFYFRCSSATKLLAKLEETPESAIRRFVEDIVSWDGVVDSSNRPQPCTRETKQAFPTGDKLQVVGALYRVLALRYRRFQHGRS